MAKGLSWFRENNAEAYMVLLDWWKSGSNR
jgi:hypothetical protein